MIDEIESLIVRAVTEVFGTMLNLPIVLLPEGEFMETGESHVAGSIGFIGGITGVVYIYCSAKFARRLTRGLLAVPDHEIENNEMVNDAIGELANMVVGHVKSRLCDQGVPCGLTIPSIVRGSHFSIEQVSSTTRRVCFFRCEQSQFVVEVMIKPGREFPGVVSPASV